MKSSKLWVGIPLIILVFTVLLGVVLTSCDAPVEEEGLIAKWYASPEAASSAGTPAFEFLDGSKLKVGKTTYYYKNNAGKLTITKTENGTIPIGEITYNFVSDNKLHITSSWENIKSGDYYRTGSGGGGGGGETFIYADEPTANPAGGTYSTPQNVTLTATSGASIYYTTNGTTPSSTNGTLYTSAISISKTTILKAIAVKDGMLDSWVITEEYTISGTTPEPEVVNKPTASPEEGTYTTAQSVTLTSTTPDAKIYYTTDGTAPTTSKTEYKGTKISISSTTTLKAIAVKDGMTNSDIFTATYIISSSGGTQNAITVSKGDDSGAGSLRQALLDIAPNGTITIDPTVGTITLTNQLDVTKNVTIKGNSVIITRSETGDYSLIDIKSNVDVNIDRVHFKFGKEETGGVYGGGAIYTIGSVTVTSCIFNQNKATNGGAISTRPKAATGNTPSVPAGATTVKGCTFYYNTATNGGAINHASGTLTLIGNLFFKNDAGTGKIVNKVGSATVISYGYNIADVTLGTGTGQSGFNDSKDTTFTAKGITFSNSVPTPFVDTTDFVPGISLKDVLPSTLPVGFPTTDFKGKDRANRSPGAVD